MLCWEPIRREQAAARAERVEQAYQSIGKIGGKYIFGFIGFCTCSFLGS